MDVAHEVLRKLGHIVRGGRRKVDCVVEYLESLEWDCPSVLAKFCKQLMIRLWFSQAKLGSRR